MQPKQSGDSHTKQGSAETQTQPQETNTATAAASPAQGPPLAMATSIEGSTSPAGVLASESHNEATAGV